MEPFENETENSSSKPVTGVRTAPALKEALINEAAEAGISLSEYCETILYNRHKGNGESEHQMQTVAELTMEIERLKVKTADGAQLSEVLQTENKELREQITTLKNQLVVFQDQRLLQILDEIKGRTDEIPLPNGKIYRPVYNTAQDLLYGMIYSFETKKS